MLGQSESRSHPVQALLLVIIYGALFAAFMLLC